MLALARMRSRAVWFVMLSGIITHAASNSQAQQAPNGSPATLTEGSTMAEKPISGGGLADAPKADAPKGDTKKTEEPKSAWYEHPKVRVAPRPAFFPVLPSGPGYYSLWDCVHGAWRDNAPKSAYPRFALMPRSFFDADFRYIDDPKRTTSELFDGLHRIHIGDCWLFNTGGQAWWRHMHEINSRFLGVTNDYDLLRVRIFGDLWYKDAFRVYAELLSAHSVNEDLPHLPIDEDRLDFLNLFVDIKLCELACQPFYVRVGRQELTFGSQRLISPPDWANTRRTFQGVRAFRQSEKLDMDFFWVRPVIPHATRFDSWDENVNFAGAWFTYRPQKGHALDCYYLYLDNSGTINTKVPTGQKPFTLDVAPTLVHTIGSRYVGDYRNTFLWDFEGMFQAGERGSQNIRAGAATAGLGYHCEKMLMNPTVWAYYDWASGDPSPNTGNYNTFHQLFPFGHYYFGWLDLIGRQNIRDVNFHLYLYPTKWITFNSQYHCFQLDRASDALYGVAGAPLRISPNGSAGGHVGQELDMLVNVHLSSHSDILVGYSKLFAGDFVRNTAPNGQASRSPELFYFIYNIRW